MELKLYIPKKHLREMLKGKVAYTYKVNGHSVKVGETEQMHRFDELERMKGG